MSYQLDEISTIGLEYQYRSTLYEADDRVDRMAHRVRLPYSRWFNHRLDLLTLRPSYSRTTTEANRDIDYYNLAVGWTHVFSETLRMRNFLGYGHAVASEDGNRDSTSSGTADLNLTSTDENFSFNLGFRSNIILDADGELEEVDRLYCRLRKRLTERLSARLYGSIYITRPPETYDAVDNVYYDIKPELSYAITERHSLNLFYRHSFEEDQTVSKDPESVRNIVEINLVFQFPSQK
jgi:hypothetical protein